MASVTQKNSSRHKVWREWGTAQPLIVSTLNPDFPSLNSTMAPYLPVVAHESKQDWYIVVREGVPIGLDSNNYQVPMGLALDIDAGAGAGELEYTATDVSLGIKDAAGVLCVAGNKVADALISESITINGPIGILGEQTFVAPDRAYTSIASRKLGSGGTSTDMYYQNFNIQNPHRPLITKGILELPVVLTVDNIALDGIPVFNASDGLPVCGAEVRTDKLNHYVNASTETVGRVFGHVIDWIIDGKNDEGWAYLRYVQSLYDENKMPDAFSATDPYSFGDVDKRAGSATDGLLESENLAGSDGTYGIVRIMLTGLQ